MPLIRKELPNQAGIRDASPTDAFSSLLSRNSEERRAAAREFIVTSDNAAVISSAIQSEAVDGVLQALFTALMRSANAASVDVALQYLRSDDARLRTGALDALRALQDQLLPRLTGLLSDPEPDVRILACELVRAQQPSTVIDLLVPLLANDCNGSVCGAAIDVMAEVAAPDHVALLLHCAARFPSDPFLDFAAKTAALRIGARNAPQ
ncbi:MULTISPECIES: HEAT repeat domain-containing protein [unclassified Mesorhizobium]|uniref:HEAT repeat domain-containing protein n=1 Tax=unclassified Mesorhizobium TaxID=325217 RepID=UPI00333C562C